MATTSTAPLVIDALLTAVNADLPATVKAYEAWPGPSASPEMVVLGEVEWEDYELATIKTGRQQRQEVYAVGFDVFVFCTPGTTPVNIKPQRDRAYELLAVIEDLLAEDPGGHPAVAWLEVRPTTGGTREFLDLTTKAYAYRVAGTIRVNARLT